MHFGDGCTFGLVPMGAGRTYGFASYVDRCKPRAEGRQRQSMAVGESLRIPSAARNAALHEKG